MSSPMTNFDVFFMFPIRITGEQEFKARNAGLSSIIVFSTIIPLLLLIIVVSYRHIKQKNLEAEAKEQEIYFAELEQERQKIYSKMYDDQHQKEIEIVKYLAEQEEKQSNSPLQANLIQSMLIDGREKPVQIDHHNGDSTDDEFFEMPLPALPTPSPKSSKLSIFDNEGVLPSAPPTSKIQDTPKIDNITSTFTFPPISNHSAPTPSTQTPREWKFDPLSLPHVPPRPPSLSSPSFSKSRTTENDQRDSTQPVIVDLTPRPPLLQSDF